ncbi:MAG: hypothetical protein HXX08_25120 [Chloroflexi bacterium]|uniref:DUF2202 domain-containing protein n=1 Tax=Candidatus Chlorohelix allophototropha TaxID=3003348 RepID=A0A8T7LTR2_9CHLR|nr:hypothetical protein [Chloroflexota bacterium]NWJ49152.1 hypothetical protein [Chloroflexota bacterium]WJW66160.1 DUF2202 domain-containing protein [Chloroflexota bacterium L227-S17]
MKAKWFMGLGLIVALLVGLFAAVVPSDAQAYGSGGRGNGTGTTTPGAQNGGGYGMQPGTGMGMNQGMGQMRGAGGARNGMGQQGTGAYATVLSEQSVNALNQAIQEEYLARATYQAILAKFGQVLPFSNIVNSENQHVTVLARQFTNHGLAVPADSWAGKVTAPATLSEAFNAAIQLEKDDAALYDTLLKQVSEPELTRVFTQLQSASLNMHLKELELYNK